VIGANCARSWCKAIIPGVIDSTSSFVEHPEHAKVVGRENVMTRRGLWMKLASLSEGARLASRQLW
jgi:5-methyltetrahydropteroyltriglutamate--homocysteine methyltransferase